tara:strand:- start:134 stop:484 length:351 start_codon:yes stop_codon:yes gene_type:complete
MQDKPWSYMNKFELILLFNPDLGNDLIKTEISNIKSKISSQSGKIIDEEDWGLRDLSYTINKFKKSFYKFIQIEISGDIVKSLNKELNQSENLLRYLFIKVRDHQELPTKLKYEKK